MPTNWPASLPYHVLRDQFQYSPGSGIIRDTVDAGYPIIRRRYTGTVDTYSVSILMTYDEFTTFEAFFRNSPDHLTVPGIYSGSVQLNFPEPLWSPGAGETEDDRPSSAFRWISEKGKEPYSVKPDGDSNDLVVSFKLEKLP
jgi:hypothetical protein